MSRGASGRMTVHVRWRRYARLDRATYKKRTFRLHPTSLWVIKDLPRLPSEICVQNENLVQEYHRVLSNMFLSRKIR